MSFLIADYNRLLAAGIWVFFASGMLLLKTPGHGVAYLGPTRTRLQFPSWRAGLGRRLALAVHPVLCFWPMADVSLLAPSRQHAMDELYNSATQLSRSMRYARPFLVAVTLIVVCVIPTWVLARGAGLVFLLLASSAYALYAVGLAILVSSGEKEDRRRLRCQWRVLLEPLLCLPYGSHLCRKLSEKYRLSVSLVDVLRSDAHIHHDDLLSLALHITEVESMSDDANDIGHMNELKNLIRARLHRDIE